MKIAAIGNIFKQKRDENVSFGTTLKGFPHTVEAGISKNCNLRCPYCPNSLIEKKLPDEIMPMSLFEKMLMDLKAIDFDGILHFHRFNEPTLVRVEDYIIKAKEILPKIVTELFTNGTKLTKERLESLKKTHLDKIIVTQQKGVTNGFMERLKDIPDSLLDNIDTKYWDELNLVNRAGILGQTEKSLEEPCYSLHTNLGVDSDGIIPLCIDDYYRQVVLGDIKKETIEEIWTKPSTRELFNKLDEGKRSEIIICKDCDRTCGKRANQADLSKNNALYRKHLLITTGSAHIK